MQSFVDGLRLIEDYSGNPVVFPKPSIILRLISLLECRNGECLLQSHEVVEISLDIEGAKAR